VKGSLPVRALRTLPALLLCWGSACQPPPDRQPLADPGVDAAAAGLMSHDEAFLRELADHREGLLTLARHAREHGGNALEQEAARLEARHVDEQRDLLDLLWRDFAAEHEAALSAPMRRALARLDHTSAADYARVWVELLIDHHREGQQLAGEYLRDLRHAEARELARRSRDMHISEIGLLQAGLTGS
jgi:hypothetical protein